MLGVGVAVHAEPEDSITVVVSAEESVQYFKLVDVPDSSYAVPYKVVYEEVKGINTVVYSWVAEMPRFIYEGAGTVAHANAFDEYVRRYGLYDHIADTTFHATYDAVIERDGSVSNLQHVGGNGTTAFQNKVERMLLDMPRWKPGYHKDAAQRVWVRLNICHPNSSGESVTEFVGKPRMTKREVEQPRQTAVTRIPAKEAVHKQLRMPRPQLEKVVKAERSHSLSNKPKANGKVYTSKKDRSKELLDSIMQAMPDTVAAAKSTEHVYAKYRNKAVTATPRDPVTRMREVMRRQADSISPGTEYPDYYGGAYMSGNRIVVLITEELESSSEVEELKKELRPGRNIIYRTCKNSYNSLKQVEDSIIAHGERGTPLALNIGMFYILNSKNKVGVHLTDASEERRQELFDTFGKDKVMIIGSGPITVIDH